MLPIKLETTNIVEAQSLRLFFPRNPSCGFIDLTRVTDITHGLEKRIDLGYLSVRALESHLLVNDVDFVNEAIHLTSQNSTQSNIFHCSTSHK